MSKAVSIIFPHQLFEQTPLFGLGNDIYLVEEWLFFKQYNFHKQKIAFHRATMKCYQDYLIGQNHKVNYIAATDETSDIRILIQRLAAISITHIDSIDPVDNWLQKRIAETARTNGITVQLHDSPLFLNTKADNAVFFKASKKKFFQTTFYTDQRKKRKILVDSELVPIGGKWTFDTENRKKYPKGKTPPSIQLPDTNQYHKEAKTYVANNFGDNLGSCDTTLYPIDFESSKSWLADFLAQRFHEFGVYEDAIVSREHFLNHSVLTPMLNVGLLTPQYILEQALSYAEQHDIPINSTEGFVRQIIGWREFIRGVYECKGSQERTTNYWKFDKKIPSSWYDGTTGIAPVDQTIKKVLKTGYCHHIERLMVLGNFMMLNEFDPNEVYRWFMELFIDAYDWVMVTNIYGMSQFADGGLMATKPYISSSNYLMKMSNYKKGEWQQIWDGLFWRFMDKNRDFFLKNPRLGMLIRMFDKMDEDKKNQHLVIANDYLSNTKNLED